jgi:hypothetical protein
LLLVFLGDSIEFQPREARRQRGATRSRCRFPSLTPFLLLDPGK